MVDSVEIFQFDDVIASLDRVGDASRLLEDYGIRVILQQWAGSLAVHVAGSQ